MTYVISNACIDVKDMSCIEVCPVDCIYHEDEDRMVFIEPEQCIDCGVCVSACPVGAIFADHEIPPAAKDFIGINALYFQDKDAARAQAAERAGTSI